MNFLEDQAKEISRIREILKGHPKGLTIEEIAKKLPLNRTSTAKYLNTLLISGQAELTTFGRAKVFSLSQRVPFSQMLNLSSDLMLVLDHDLLINQVNEPFVRLFGIPRNEILGLRIDRSPLTRFFSEAALDLIKNAQTGTENIVMARIEIGRVPYFFRIKVIPVVFDQGEQGLAVILEDLTELKKHQDHLEQLVEARTVELKAANEKLATEMNERLKSGRALEESEKKYRQLVENANSMILRTDEHGYITFFSEFAESFFGVSEVDVLGKNLMGTIIPLPVHSRKSIEELNQEFLKPAKHMMFKETEVTRKNSEPAWVAWTIRELRDAGETICEFLIVGMDITVLKTYTERSQRLVEKLEAHEIALNAQTQELQRLQHSSEESERKCMANFDSAPVGFFTLDQRGMITDLNQTGANLTGIPIKAAINRLFSDFFEERDQGTFAAFLQEIFNLPGTTRSCVVCRKHDGSVPVLCRGRAIDDVDASLRICRIAVIDLPDAFAGAH